MTKFSTLLTLLLFVGVRCVKDREPRITQGVTEKNLIVTSRGEVNKINAPDRIKDLSDSVQQIFEKKVDPYMGVHLVPEKCRQENVPTAVTFDNKKAKGQIISIYSSESRMLGNCVDPEKLLKTQYLIIYCKRSRLLYTAKYYYGDNERWLTQPVVQCR